ncbi:hypothetical protein A0J61_00500 [Choanephora cucurbitarum]|uniref:Uncharacterized protein n=1 Tax=Choanephora cucurbitarum TaxID=101091 RepID=A0A1C7NSE5_9FUNG|nr:hypothetical protein A0J61_00500 [Choanephora cucurbitarum]
MSSSSSSASSPSSSNRPSPAFGTSMARSGSNRSMLRETGRIGRSRQNTVGLDFFEDLNKNIGSDYQEIQIRTLTKWINAQLKLVDDHIDNIKTDLRDGKKLLKLLSVISNEPAPKPERMNMRIHQLANVAQALSFLERHVGSDSMPDIGNEAIVNGDAKKTLALIFFIMLKYQIQLILTQHGEDFLQSLTELSERENGVKAQSSEFQIENKSPVASSRKFSSLQSLSDKLQQHNSSTTAEAKVALLYWVRIQLEDYISANIIPSIQDFSRSWRTGVAFCLLIHRHNPAYIPDLFSVHLNADLSEKTTWLHLLRLAFDLATNRMGVQPYLEPEDLVEVDYPHEPSVMMYVSEYYKIMSKHQEEEPPNVKRERAVKRKAAIVMASGGILADNINPDNDDDDDDDEEVLEPNYSILDSLQQEEPMEIEPDVPEAPVPIPIPSARRKKKMQQRRSTLGDADKARIKADLNTKLMMQLTGHLPRGVHPVLDELLTIHDTVLSFIKSNTRTIDEIPDEFANSSSVTEYIDALEIVEEQADDELHHLETAKGAKETLTAPPEKADETLIHLTDLQRTQVVKLYEMLQKEWTQFLDLLKATKEDLLSVETALIDTEEGVEQYQARATAIEAQLDRFRQLLQQIAPSINHDSNENDEATLLHPLEGSLEDATSYQERLANFSAEFSRFENGEWKEFKKATRQLSRSIMQAVNVRSNGVTHKYDNLVEDLEKEKKACRNFERGLKIISIVKSVETELDAIQSLMEDDGQEKATTDDAIQVLESKVAAVRSTIFGIKEEFDDILTSDDRFAQLFSGIHQRYEMVNQWVDQVRVWFIEAERISGWIEERIKVIQEQNDANTIDPLCKDISEWQDKAKTDPVYKEHDQLKRDIERFDKDDMARLRSHVRLLTVSAEHHLSPADASTIEITLTTLNILNRLMSLLRTRSKIIDTLRIRILWESMLEAATFWIEQKNTDITAFMDGKARWKETGEDDATSHSIKLLNEEIIQTLVQLENSIAEFDKGDYTRVLDTYQEMEGLKEEPLPEHMELRQESFESLFEWVMKRCSFARRMVEQNLVVNDIMLQYRKLKAEGEKLKLAMAHGTDSASSDDDDDSQSFSKRVQAFKDSSSHWVTILLKQIPYPETPEGLEDRQHENNTANEMIHHRMNQYATCLAEITEELEELLASHRENLSLQQRASLAFDDLLRITTWIEERIRAIHKFDAPTLLDEDNTINLEEDTFHRLEKEHDGISVRLEHMEASDIKKAIEAVRLIEIEIKETHSTSVDPTALIDGINNLEQALSDLKEALASRVAEIKTLKRRIAWESEWDEANSTIKDLAHRLWDFDNRFAQYDVDGLKKRNSDLEIGDQALEVNKDQLFIQLLEQVDSLETDLAILKSDVSYTELSQAYDEYNHGTEGSGVPLHISFKQKSIKQSSQDLHSLSQYVHGVIQQSELIMNFIRSSYIVQKEGEQALGTIQNSLREASSSTRTTTTAVAVTAGLDDIDVDSQKMEEHIKEVLGKIDDVCRNGKSIKRLEGGNWFEACQPQTLIKAKDYASQVDSLLYKRLDDLTKLSDSMQNLLTSYYNTDEIKAKLANYFAESNEIQDLIEKATHTLNQHQIDVAAASGFIVTTAKLSEYRADNVKMVSEIKKLELSRINEFEENLKQLTQEVSSKAASIAEEVTESCKILSENVSRTLHVFHQTATNRSLVIDTAEGRLEWEKGVEENQARLDFINHQLQQYVSKKNKCVAQQEMLSIELVNELVQERSDIANQCQRFWQESMNALLTQYERVKSLFIKLPLTKSVPIHLQERMEVLTRTIKKLEDALLWREEELEYIDQRCKLELNIKDAMSELDQYKKSISTFVEAKCRWNSNESVSTNQHQQYISSLENEWKQQRNKFEKYCSSILSEIKQNQQRLQEISNTLKPGFMSELHIKKIDAMSQIEDYIDADILFAQDLVKQKKQVYTFLSKASDLEKQAEGIRETLLASTKSQYAMTTSSLTVKLKNFASQVETLRVFASSNIITPKRSNENEIAMPTKVKDKTMNSVIQDVISTRIGRLDELVESLSALLKSQEILTRLQYILKTFDRQVLACNTWISSRRDILERSVDILDDTHLSLDINHLRDAVSEADSIRTAMEASDNHFTLLCKYRDEYIQVFDQQGLLDEQEKDEKMAEYDQVVDSFEGIGRQWDDLLLETKEVSNALSLALLPAELNSRISSLMTSFEELQSQIRSVDEASVTDNHISEWQKRIDFLESKEYDRLHAEMKDFNHNISADMIESLMHKLDSAGETILEIRSMLASLYDIINASRLRNTHTENSTLFHNSAERLSVAIADIQTGKFSIITDKQTSEERTTHFKELNVCHKQVKEMIVECQGFYDDSRSYYTAIKVQDVSTPECQLTQQKVEEVWEKTQKSVADLSAFVTRTSKWIEGCDELDRLHDALHTLQIDVQKALNGDQQFFSPQNSKIHKYERQLSKLSLSHEELENTVNSTKDLSQDEANKASFLARSQQISELKNCIQSVLEKRRADKERVVLFEAFKTEVNRNSKICEDQISYIRQQSIANPENHIKKLDSINNIINVYSAALSHIQDNYNDSKAKYDGIISDYATKLVKTYGHSQSEIESSKNSIHKLLNDLNSALKIEQGYITSLKLLSRLVKFDKEISRSIVDLKASVSRSYNSGRTTPRGTRAKEMPELRDFMQRYDAIESSVQDFYDKCNELKKGINKRISVSRVNALNKAVEKRREDMNRKWIEIKSSADETREKLNIIHKRQALASKLAESLKFVDDLKDRIEVLQLSGKNISVEEQELDEIQKEIDVTLKKNASDIDVLLKAIGQSEVTSATGVESTLKNQRDRLVRSIEELRELVKHRRKQARTEGSITEFFGIISQIDAEIKLLSKVVEKTSTQNASVVGSKFNKADLQTLLKTLTTAAKKIEPHITELIAKAKSESQKQFLDDNERVAERIRKTMKDWADMQASVSSRERELQICIKELNHEFFTKLAMAKSAPKERRTRRGSRSNSNAQLPPSSARSFRSSTLSTEMKVTSPTNSTGRKARTPSSSSGIATPYVADPKNELDMQLGMIVNESPYRMRVKKVPGEAGKYWFGEDNPRLVYCRILPSKMVMVRVGGGWEELSNDNLATKSEAGETQYLTVDAFNDPATDSPSFSVTTRSGSPMGPAVGTPIIRRGSGVSSTVTSRLAGYAEGNKYVSVSEDGKQTALKMVKAENGAKSPSNRK